MGKPTQKQPAAGGIEFDRLVRIARCGIRGDGQGVRSALSGLDESSDGLAAALQRHQLGELAVQALRADDPGSRLAGAIADGLERVRWFPPVEARVLLAAFVELQEAFRAVHLPVLILKGAVLAQRLYGGLDRRPQYDLDLLITRAGARRARQVTRGLGYELVRRYQHAVSLRRAPIEVDLHWALRSAPAYRIDYDRVWEDAVPVKLDQVAARTLSDEHLLLLLASSLVEDAALGTARLKQLCDLWLLAQELDASFDWDAWFQARRSERLETVVANGLALTLGVLDAWGDAPRLGQALESRSALLRIGGREQATMLLASSGVAAANSKWFDSVYPGSPFVYRMHSFVTGLPASLRDVRPARYLPSRLRPKRA